MIPEALQFRRLVEFGDKRPTSRKDEKMPLIPDVAALEKRLAALPVSTYQQGEIVLAAGSTTQRLLVLRQGVVEVVRDGIQIAKISEPGAVFGELSALLDKPHTADVRALEPSKFNVAEVATLLASDPVVAMYIAAILARRLDGANEALVEVKQQLAAGKPRGMIAKTVEKVEGLLSSHGGNLVYAGYPYDPFASVVH
jgi:CRP-like cAMP-binding protein